MSFQNYLSNIEAILNEALSIGNVSLIEFQAEPRSTTIGFLAGVLQFGDGSQLHFREYVDTGQPEPRRMYAYHFQDADKRLVFRYDNAAHRPPLSTPEHKHTTEGVAVSLPPTLREVLDEIGI